MKLRVGSFNLFQYVAPPYCWYTKKEKFTPEQWEQKQAWIKKQILNMNCDVIGFQEVFSKNELQELCLELGFKYFVTVDEAKLEGKDKNIFSSTTVALASKYEILELKDVEINIKSLKKHLFKGKFEFSRKPIKAKIKIRENLNITIYVNHFKSNRLNEFEYIFKKEDSLDYKKEKVKEALKNDYSPALKQRLCETSSLYYDFKKEKEPIICMCDLNDKEFSLSIDALTNKAYHENKKFNSYLLYDSNYLNPKKESNPHPEKRQQRVPTSYYMGNGNVLDYIFVSKEFNKRFKENIGKVVSYEVFDNHLKENKDGSLLQSDHAQVVCEIELF